MMYLPNEVKYAIDMLNKAGFSAYVVGGAVRDALMGKIPHDYDLCTLATPEQMKEVFKCERIIETGISHGTLTILIDNKPLEITTFRKEAAYTDFRRPDSICFVSNIDEDLSRRDFTINAIAYSQYDGFIDLFGGRNDLENKILKAVGNADERFSEDALRILRGLRMASEYGFEIEQKTKNALKAKANLLLNISAERISTELMRLICGRYAGKVIREFIDVFGVILPEILPMKNLEQKNPYHIYDVLEHSIRTMEQVKAEPVLRFAALYHDTGKPECMTIDKNGIGHFYSHPKISKEYAKFRTQKLKLSKVIREEIIFLIEHHDSFIKDEPHIIRRKLVRFGETRLRNLIRLQKADSIARGTHEEYLSYFIWLEKLINDVINEKPCLSVKNLPVNGYDLMSLGFKGKQIGDILNKMLGFVLENPKYNTKEILLNLLKEGKI